MIISCNRQKESAAVSRRNSNIEPGRLLGFGIWLALLVLLNASQLFAADQQAIGLSFLDVGQGDALLIHEPGSCTALIDAGPLVNGHRITSKLQEMQVEKLDLVVITHPHLDHFGGLFDIAPRIPIKQFYDNGQTNPAWKYFDDYLNLRSRLNHATLRRGDELHCGSIRFTVLYPDRTADGASGINDYSLAMMVSVHSTQFMHMGDLAGNGARHFLQLNDDINADIMKIAHHGASDAASRELLDRVSPAFAIISSSDRNRIYSPADGTLERLAAAGIHVSRTDQDGTVNFVIDGKGVRLLPP